jgi:hypothetical protein
VKTGGWSLGSSGDIQSGLRVTERPTRHVEILHNIVRWHRPTREINSSNNGKLWVVCCLHVHYAMYMEKNCVYAVLDGTTQV